MRALTVFRWTKVIIRALLTVAGVLVTAVALSCFLLVINALPLQLPWPQVVDAVAALGEYHQISLLVLVAFGIAMQFMRPEILPNWLPVRKSLARLDTKMWIFGCPRLL